METKQKETAEPAKELKTKSETARMMGQVSAVSQTVEGRRQDCLVGC